MEKYLIDNEEYSEEAFNELLEEEIREYVENNYDDILDEIYEPYKIGCCTFDASRVLIELDPIAYNCGINDEVNARLSDAQYALERDGRFVLYGYYFEIEED